MDRDNFIIAVYLVVCEHYQAIKKQYRIRRGGFPPALTDEEVITMEICGEYFKIECDKDIFSYFYSHYLHFFPKLKERSLFVRQAANLWKVKAAIQRRLVVISGQVTMEVETQFDSRERQSGGTITFRVDGEQVGQGRFENSVPVIFTASETFDIGMDLGSPVSLDYHERAPFKFNGKIEKVNIKYI